MRPNAGMGGMGKAAQHLSMAANADRNALRYIALLQWLRHGVWAGASGMHSAHGAAGSHTAVQAKLEHIYIYNTRHQDRYKGETETGKMQTHKQRPVLSCCTISSKIEIGKRHGGEANAQATSCS